MSKGDVMLGLQMLLAAALMVACFCRLVRTDGSTLREARWSIVFEFMSAGILFGAPFLPLLMPEDIHWAPLTTPAWCWVLLLTAVVATHIAVAPAWASGHVVESLRGTRRAGSSGFILPAMAVVLSLFALANVPTAHAEGLTPPPTYEYKSVHAFQKGEMVECSNAEGCVGLTAQAFRELVDMARTGYQQTACRKDRSL